MNLLSSGIRPTLSAILSKMDFGRQIPLHRIQLSVYHQFNSKPFLVDKPWHSKGKVPLVNQGEESANTDQSENRLR